MSENQAILAMIVMFVLFCVGMGWMMTSRNHDVGLAAEICTEEVSARPGWRLRYSDVVGGTAKCYLVKEDENGILYDIIARSLEPRVIQ